MDEEAAAGMDEEAAAASEHLDFNWRRRGLVSVLVSKETYYSVKRDLL